MPDEPARQHLNQCDGVEECLPGNRRLVARQPCIVAQAVSRNLNAILMCIVWQSFFRSSIALSALLVGSPHPLAWGASHVLCVRR